MPTGVPRSAAKRYDFAPLNQAPFFYSRVSEPEQLETAGHALDLEPTKSDLTATVLNQVNKALQTSSQGIPPEFANAWEWAAHWVRANGVTLPPDTSHYRGLRNWFCYQVNRYKKNQLSAKSRVSLAAYGIDLSKYRAENTGRGERMNDDLYVQALRQHFVEHGTYNLHENCGAGLLQWQTRLLNSYTARGTSTRMRHIAVQLTGFAFGQWLRPGEPSIPDEQLDWWTHAAEFQLATQDCPAFRGRIDPATPRHLRTWALAQITLADRRSLSPRQRGELLSLNLLARPAHRMSQRKSAELARARGAQTARPPFGERERDLKTFLGATLLAHLLRSNAKLTAIYSTFCITPAQFARIRNALTPLMLQIVSLSTKTNILGLRKTYRLHSSTFDALQCATELPSEAYEAFRPSKAKRIEQLAAVILQIRDAMRRIDVQQDLLRPDLPFAH